MFFFYLTGPSMMGGEGPAMYLLNERKELLLKAIVELWKTLTDWSLNVQRNLKY